MATKLFLRNTTTNGITDTGDGILYDMVTDIGAALDASVTATTASGTEIQILNSTSSASIAWISGKVPAGGFTLTTTDISIWALESNMSANTGGRYRVFKRTAAGVLTELGGGPFNDGVEFTVGSIAQMTWLGNVTDTAFAEDDRILLRVYLTNVGTMGGGFTCEVDFNGAAASMADSFFNIAETVAFKAEGGGSPPPNGWWRPFETTAARTLLPAALIASGLVWCPQPIAASPSNEVTIDKWQQPLSKAPPVARAIQGDSFVPFDTAQVVAATRDTAWQPPLSVAPQTARAVHSQPVFVPTAFAQYPLGWHQALGIAPPVAKAQPGSTFVPFNTAQTNTATIDKWQVPLSVPAPVAKAQQGSAFVPFDTAQTNTSTIDKWQQPFVAAVKLTGPVHTQPSFVAPPFEVPRGWQSQLSVAPATTKARLSDQPFAVDPVTAADNTVTLDKWQQPLSIAVPVAKARQGDAFVPFNTVQTVPGLVTYDKYQQPLSVAPKTASAVHTNVAFVPLPFPQYPLGWQQPLSKAAPVAKSVFVDVPFVARGTQLTQNTVDIGKWQQPLSVSVKAAAPSSPALVYTPYEPAVVVGVGIDGIAWLNPLGIPIPPVVYSLSPFTGFIPTVLTTVEPPEPPVIVPEVHYDPAGIKSGVWKPRKAKAYRSYRFLKKEEIEQLTGTEIRQAARDLREDVRDNPLAEEVAKEAAALARMADALADIDRLEASVAELTRAIEFAAEQKAKAEADAAQQEQDDDDAATLLLS